MKCFFTLLSFFILNLLYGQSFEDHSISTNFNQPGHNIGMAIGDLDGNGLPDIYVSRKGSSNLLYRNIGDFQFEEVGENYNLDFNGNTNCSLWFDMDNDGDDDLFLGNMFESNKLYRNNNGTFEDVSIIFGISNTIGNVHSVNAADIDNDGDLDLYVAQSMAQNILWRNEGTHFVNYTTASGINDEGPSMGAVFFDYDNDGNVDLYQTRDNDAGNLFYRNDGGYFTDISDQSNTDYEGHGMGVDVADLNGDGLLDFYLTNLYENVLFIQNSNNSFEQHLIEGINDNGMGWGTAIFDSNNNGLKDIYLANESDFAVAGTHQSNKLFVNQGNLEFYNPTTSSSIQNMYSSYSVAHADFDNDGKMDFVCANAGEDGNQIFKNTSADKNYLNINLEGTNSNSKGIGARVYVDADDASWMDISTCGTGYAAQNSSTFHFGLNDKNIVDNLTIHWPSGNTQTLENIDVNQTITVNESTGLVSAGPIVWTDPPFATQLDDITLYYDAAEGNGALLDFEGDVYAHTGVITNQSTAPSDWQHVQGNWGTPDPNVLMTDEGGNVYSLVYNIEDYYGIDPGEVVEEMAFVFRSADGSVVGRDVDGSDIFLEVYPPTGSLLVNLISPQGNNTIINQGEDLLIDIQSNQLSQIEITDNGNNIYSNSTQQATFTINPTALGAHTLIFTVSVGTEVQEIERTYFVIDSSSNTAPAPNGTRDGVNYYTDNSYVFFLTAPEKSHVFLLCPANNYQVDIDYQLQKAPDNTTFWIELPKSLFQNGQNNYQYLVDGQIKIADPYAEVVLDPWNDDWVPDDVKAELPDYPEDMTSGIVTAFDIEQNNYDWQIANFEKPKKTDLVIYELLMRDFVEDKNYKSLLDTLNYLENLGVNAIELMPIQEFEGNQSWGYNPSFHMAVDKYYGSRNQLRTVIDEAHQRGIAVILDVVFNHAFSQSPLCQLYWNSADFQPAADNPWLNETPRHPFNVGYDFNHESVYTKAWVKRVLEHWITEYKFDGFRFDLSKGMTQTFTGSNADAMSQYDLSRVNILKDYADFIWSLDDDSYVILEHFAVNTEEQDLADYGMMLWGNVTHEFAEAAMGYNSDLDWADYNSRGWSNPHLIAYMESHDEERMGYKLQNFGDANADYDTRELATGTDRIAAASAIFLSLPGPKMLWQFGELHYDFSINRCVNGTINPNCRLDPKPIRWDYFEDTERRDLYDRVAAINHLRTTYPTFETIDYTFHDGNFFLKTINLNHAEMDAVVMANFRIVDSEVNPRFPYTGTWYEYFTGAELEVSLVEEKLDFLPGEYRIYLSEPIEPPGGYFPPLVSSTTSFAENNIEIYPTILESNQDLVIDLSENQIVTSIEIIDLNGKSIPVSFDQNSHQINVNLPELPASIYIVKMHSNSKIYTGKIVVQ